MTVTILYYGHNEERVVKSSGTLSGITEIRSKDSWLDLYEGTMLSMSISLNDLTQGRTEIKVTP
jgi:hypothetical protein